MSPPALTYLDVCAGISAATLAWKPLGWKCLGYAEKASYPSRVLAHHYPDTPNFGNILNYREWRLAARPDILAGGTPCQGFSLAGLLKGMADPRSQLALTFVEIAALHRPPWLVWENVSGVLSSNGGKDFAAILAAFTGRNIRVPAGGWQNSGVVEGIAAAYGIAWRVFDSQFFAVPQRRRRVFLVGHLGDWRRAAAVLLEREGMRGDSPPRRGSGEAVASTVTSRFGNGCRSAGSNGNIVPEIASTLDASYGRLQGCSGQDLNHGHSTLVGVAEPMTTQPYADGIAEDGKLVVFGGNNTAGPIEVAAALNCNRGCHSPGDFEAGNLLVFDPTQITHTENRSNPQPGDPCHTLAKSGHAPCIAFDCRQDPVSSTEFFGSLGASSPQAQAIAVNMRGREGGNMPELDKDGLASIRAASGGSTNSLVGYTVHGSDSAGAMATETELCSSIRTKPPGEVQNSSTTAVLHSNYRVRRLTPIECERLMGVPDNFTRIPRRNKKTGEPIPGKYYPDAPRYFVLGNSIVVPVLSWIGRRIELVHRLPSNP